MFFRKVGLFGERGHDSEAIARIKNCSLWSHVEFTFVGDDPVHPRLVRVATALFRASESKRNLIDFIKRVTERDGRITVTWVWPGPPVEWIRMLNAAWKEVGGLGFPSHYYPER